jgi:hypothetical protein
VTPGNGDGAEHGIVRAGMFAVSTTARRAPRARRTTSRNLPAVFVRTVNVRLPTRRRTGCRLTPVLSSSTLPVIVTTPRRDVARSVVETGSITRP